jgi:hypothetical protein
MPLFPESVALRRGFVFQAELCTLVEPYCTAVKAAVNVN